MQPQHGVMNMQQLELFPEPLEYKQQREFEYLEDKCERLRKSLHARSTRQEKRIAELENQLAFLMSKICKEGLFL